MLTKFTSQNNPGSVNSPKLLAAAISVLALSHASIGAAQQLEEVVVTAQKKAESLQDVALTVQTFSGEAVNESGITDIEMLSENMPAITIARSANSQRIVVRGIGSGSNNGFEQSVGTFVDGIYYGRGQQIRPKFLDIARIEALKGPQSTLFGTNVTAGAISITSNNPTEEFEGEIMGLVGEDNEYDTNLILSGPLTDRLLGRLALYTHEYDGYMDNSTFDDNVAQASDWGGRGVLMFNATDDLSFRLAYEHHDLDQKGFIAQNVIYADNGLPTLGDPGKFDYNNAGGVLNGFTSIDNGKVKDTNKFDTVSLLAVYEGDGFTVTSLSGYTEYDWDNVIDVDYTSANIIAQSTEQDFKQWSQELRLEGTLLDEVEYMAGLYYHHQELDQHFVSELLQSQAGANVADSHSSQDTDTYAAFVQGTYSFTDQFRTTLGLRYSDDQKDVKDSLTMNNPTFVQIGFFGAFEHDIKEDREKDHVSWLARVEYDINDDILTYANATQGYKSGGFDINGLGSSMGTTPSPDFEFEDEKATGYEIGAKMSLWDNAATLNTAAFYTEYDKLQVSQFTGAGFSVGNAAKAIVQGVEVDYRQAVTDELILSAIVSYQDFEFDDYKGAACNQRQENGLESGCVDGTQDLSNEDGQFAPEWSANVALDYETAITSGLNFRGNVTMIYSDDYYTQLGLDKNAQQDSYTKFNARVALASSDDTWEVAVIGRNLTDEDVSVNSFDNAIKSNFPLTYVKFITQPRYFALQGTYRF